MIQPFDFAYVVKRKGEDTPLRRGDLVLVMGHTLVPASSSDPYLKRVLVAVAATENGIPLIPKNDNDYKSYILDPRNLQKVSKEEQDKLVELLSEDRSL